MAVISLPADATTLVLNGTIIAELGVGDFLTLTPANEATAHVNSSNGGVNINKRTDAEVYDLALTVQKYSESDSFLNNALRGEEPTIFNGSCKTAFNRDGTDGIESWILENGSFTTQPTDTKNDQDGNATMEYTIRFRRATRNI
jgi:hypothetical protein